MTDDKIKEAVEEIEESYRTGDIDMTLPVLEAINKIKDLAERYLAVEGWPKKLSGNHDDCWEIDIDYCIPCGENVDVHPERVWGFNEALALCKLAHLKAMPTAIPTVEEIESIIITRVREDEGWYINNLAKALAKRIGVSQ